jgi:hypothetical protein
MILKQLLKKKRRFSQIDLPVLTGLSPFATGLRIPATRFWEFYTKKTTGKARGKKDHLEEELPATKKREPPRKDPCPQGES